MKRLLQRPHLISATLLLYWLALFVLTHLPIQTGSGSGHSDKLLHFGAYAGLSLLMVTLAARGQAVSWISQLVVVLLAGGYGVADELLQAFVPSRTPDLYDWFADMAGVLGGIAIYAVVQHLVTTAGRLRTNPNASTESTAKL